MTGDAIEYLKEIADRNAACRPVRHRRMLSIFNRFVLPYWVLKGHGVYNTLPLG